MNDRTQQQSQINLLTPTVELTELQTALIQDSYCFKKSVFLDRVAYTAIQQLDYSVTDLYNLTCRDVDIRFINLEDGQKVQLHIIKGVNNIITFSQNNLTVNEQIGKAHLFFDIVKVGTVTLVNQITPQSHGVISLTDFTSMDFTTVTGASGEFFIQEDTVYCNFDILLQNDDTIMSPQNFRFGFTQPFNLSKTNGIIPLTTYTANDVLNGVLYLVQDLIIIGNDGNIFAPFTDYLISVSFSAKIK